MLMAPLTTGMLSSLGQAIDQIPKQDSPYGNQSLNQLKHRARDRRLFRKLVAKLAGEDKDDQVSFMINQSRRVSSKTYVNVVLESIPEQPDYVALEKKTDKLMLMYTASLIKSYVSQLDQKI